MSTIDPSQFTDEDQFNPIYCVQCKKHTPRSQVSNGGYCPECNEGRVRVPLNQPDPSPSGPAPYAAAPAPRAIDSLPPDLAFKLKQATPSDLQGWNWGAFFLSWIWALGHQLWGMAALGFFLGACPLGGLAFGIYLGINGNRLAWESREWSDVESFRSAQKIWAIIGLVLFILYFILIFANLGSVLLQLQHIRPNSGVITTPAPTAWH